MLKTKTITTDKATLLVVEVPKGAREVTLNTIKFETEDLMTIQYTTYEKYKEGGVVTKWVNEDLPSGNWKLLGRIPDITEEQADKVVDKSKHYSDLYKSYNADDVRPYSYAIESLSSLLQANEIYFENPIPPFKERLEDWHEAQSKVWDKERCYLFIKVD